MLPARHSFSCCTTAMPNSKIIYNYYENDSTVHAVVDRWMEGVFCHFLYFELSASELNSMFETTSVLRATARVKFIYMYL